MPAQTTGPQAVHEVSNGLPLDADITGSVRAIAHECGIRIFQMTDFERNCVGLEVRLQLLGTRTAVQENGNHIFTSDSPGRKTVMVEHYRSCRDRLASGPKDGSYGQALTSSPCPPHRLRVATLYQHFFPLLRCRFCPLQLPAKYRPCFLEILTVVGMGNEKGHRFRYLQMSGSNSRAGEPVHFLIEQEL